MTHPVLPPFAGFAGPQDAKTLLVGEAWGQDEETMRQPFVGESGKELFRMLGEAMPQVAPELHAEIVAKHKYGLAWVRDRGQWLAAASIAMTNVLAFRPPANKIEALCQSKKELPHDYPAWPPIRRSAYLRPEYLPELTRLRSELATTRPNVVVALGATAAWALLQATNIGQIRGTVTESRGDFAGLGLKCLPTYHPASVLYQWSQRPIVCQDLMKAHREAQFPEIRRPRREILVSPTLAQVDAWVGHTLAKPPTALACDCETAFGQIKCIGFARSRSEALVVPFVDEARPGWSYWPDAASESMAWALCKRLLESPIPKVFQNGLYDYQYILPLGIKPQALIEDTMLLHHSLFPELPKGLGFLGSIYTGETSWKLMRRHKADTEKKDE